jgi:hypothetical protein
MVAQHYTERSAVRLRHLAQTEMKRPSIATCVVCCWMQDARQMQLTDRARARSSWHLRTGRPGPATRSKTSSAASFRPSRHTSDQCSNRAAAEGIMCRQQLSFPRLIHSRPAPNFRPQMRIAVSLGVCLVARAGRSAGRACRPMLACP